MTLPRSCAICGAVGGSLCEKHSRPQHRKRTQVSPAKRGYGAEYQRSRRIMIDAAWELKLPCWRCGGGFATKSAITADHRIPVVLGGTGELANLRPAHSVCNSRAGGRGPRRRPVRRGPPAPARAQRPVTASDAGSA
jgi:5-methylcytosine-specific restriction endonuclease McrA